MVLGLVAGMLEQGARWLGRQPGEMAGMALGLESVYRVVI